MPKKFCVVTSPRSYSTEVCRKISEGLGPRVTMPGPETAGCELLHEQFLPEVSDLYRIPFNDDERTFIDNWYARSRPVGLLGKLKHLIRPTRAYIGFKTFPQFHRYNEFFDRSDIEFIVLHRMNLDKVFLSWCLSILRGDFGGTFDDKLSGFKFAQISIKGEFLRNLMRTLLFNHRVMSNLIARGAIELIVDENERIANNARLDDYFHAPIDLASIRHRSNYEALSDMDFYQEQFDQLLNHWDSRSSGASTLVEAFKARRRANRTNTRLATPT